MKVIKPKGLLIAMILLVINLGFLSKAFAVGGGLTVHNGTDENLCFVYVKTTASLKSKIGLDKSKHQIIYDGDVQGQEEVLPIGTSATLNAYDSHIDYDRVLWVVPAAQCHVLAHVTIYHKKPDQAVALEVGSKKNVVIVSAGPGKFKLKNWTATLGEELNQRKRAMLESLRTSGLNFADLKNGSVAQWEKAAQRFKELHKKIKSSEKVEAAWRRVSSAMFVKLNENLDKVKTPSRALATKIELAAADVFKKFKEKASQIDPQAAADIELPSFIKNLKIEDVTRAYTQLNDILKFDNNAKQHMELLTTAYETVKKLYHMLNKAT